MAKAEQSDPRVRRTKQRLDEALSELIIEKPYDKITVQDLIDRADVGRSTFYAHYETKDHLLLTNSVHRLAIDIRAGMADDPSGADAILPSLGLFRHVANGHREIKALLGSRGIDLVRDAILGTLTEAARMAIDRREQAGERSRIPPDPRAAYVAGALLAFLTWWLDNNMPHSPEDMATMFAEFTATV